MHTRTGHVELSAVANHSHNNGHEMHWTPRVLAREEDTTKRKIKEALAIKEIDERTKRWRDHQPGLWHENQQIVVRFSLKKDENYFFEKQIVLTLLNRRCVHQWRSCSLHVVRVCMELRNV